MEISSQQQIADLSRKRFSQELPFTLPKSKYFQCYIGGCYSYSFSAELLIKNLQIHYLLVPSDIYFEDMYQVKKMFESFKLILIKIMLGLLINIVCFLILFIYLMFVYLIYLLVNTTSGIILNLQRCDLQIYINIYLHKCT